MASDLEALPERVRATELLPGDSPVVVLLSGGRDSVCLLDVAALVCGPQSVHALHVNHGLRADADADEEACAALCRRLDVELTVERVARPAGAGNLHAWARDARYGAAARLAARLGARVASAHTTTDQAETILYRLAASPGRRSLLGMPVRRGLLVRPLLAAGVDRDETAAWCSARGLPWLEDPSNSSPEFARARVRTAAMPALRDLHPAAEQNLLRTAELLRDEAAVLDDAVDAALEGCDRIAADRLAGLPAALGRLVVRRLAEDATGSLCARAPGRLPEILSLAARGGGRAMLDVGDGARAVVEDGCVRFERTPAREATAESTI